MRRVILIAVPAFIIFFVFYLSSLYGQLNRAFFQEEQYIPTRIYSDVTRIAPAQTRAHVEERLQSLAYSFDRAEDQDSFALHPIAYPQYLIPDGHPVLSAFNDGSNPPVVLHFDGTDKDALLQSIELAGKEIPDLYLEPELVATLSAGGAASNKKEIRELVKFDDIPANVWKAIIAIEDPRFLEHKGLDPRGLARAIWVDLRTRSLAQGGSTITQQLVKNLMARHSRNVFQKFNELFLALLLEGRFDKQQILERYLNEVYLGQIGSIEIHGVAEGAEHFFGKKLEELNLAETALMAGLIRGPGFYSPYHHWDRAIARQRLVLKKMVDNGQIAQDEAGAALKQVIRLAPPQAIANKAPYFADFVKAELIRKLKDKMTEQEITRAGFRVYSTIDMSLNTVAQRVVSDGIGYLEKRMKLAPKDRLEGALACVDQSNGYIRALIGGRSYAQSNFNRILNMKRQVGSTFKPVVYLAAIQKGLDSDQVPYAPGHPADDAPWTLVFDKGRQSWTPRNYEKEFMGWIDYRKALAHSINTVAARLGYEVGVDGIVTTARALGIDSPLPPVPSLALGIAELSPVELLRAYSIIANHGAQDELTVIRAITEDDGKGFAHYVYAPKQIVDPAATDLLTNMLRSVFTEGTARDTVKMGFDRPAAGKTGTTSHHRDAWFAGYTPQLTTVVWVGTDENPVTQVIAEQNKRGTHFALTGATSALPIWSAFMREALQGEPPAEFPISPYLVDVQIDTHTGKLAAPGCPPEQVVTEKFIKGHEPIGTSCEAAWPPEMPKTVAQ